MKPEEKDLLLKDLCARLPYGVKGNYQNSNDELLRKVTIIYRYLEPNGMVMTGDIKPYLFPLSSMTVEQKEEISEMFWDFDNNEFTNNIEFVDHHDCFNLIDWCNKNHFDYRGLIPKGLAIDATGLNIY